MTDSLKHRLAALRNKGAATDSASLHQDDTQSAVASSFTDKPDEDDTDDVAARLAALEPPSHSTVVAVEAKHLDPQLEYEVQEYLSRASALSLSPPKTLPAQDEAAKTLKRLEDRAPLGEIGTTSVPPWSPIEVTFKPANHALSSGEPEDSADDLIKRFQDELSVERAIKGREDDNVDAWQHRLDSIKGFKPAVETKVDSVGQKTSPRGKLPTVDDLERARSKSSSRDNTHEPSGDDTDSDGDTESENSDSDSRDTDDSKSDA
ncbi:hypothetical protein OIV83_002682 [Microbotryomycetes sp. JL201]|nr:hypothetical protein OIV83_002682 [Microbotryomycetes sp. JL201]